MEENFNPVAQTRANYYTPGSPVQFVCVELLKGDVSGEHAVCLTFKNISRVTLTALEIHFKCKGVDGVILCEDKFEYRDLQVKPGELFGQDDAVFITAKAITSVDVTLCNVYNGKRVVHLDGIKRVRLPAPRRLAPERLVLRLRCLPPHRGGHGLLLGVRLRPYPVAERAEHSAAARCPGRRDGNAPQRPGCSRSARCGGGAYPHRGRSPCCSGGSRRRAHPGRGSTGLRAKG